jgi:hypothetical protein
VLKLERRLTRALFADALVLGVVGIRGFSIVGAPSVSPAMDLFARYAEGPAPLEVGDADGDGLPDALESELSQKYAPLVILDGRDGTRPTSVPWLLARVDLEGHAPEAELASVVPSVSQGSSPFPRDVRAGSSDRREWTAYTHVYPRAGGGVNIQYWFFYAYNDGPLFFDHESDWEHMTVRLDSRYEPVGVYLAQHENNSPGVYHPWEAVSKKGDHPVVLSALGTHATYGDQHELAWFERASGCSDADACSDPVWRTWEGGGLENIGEASRPLGHPEAFTYQGRWGASGVVPGTGAPLGPMQHRGFCESAFRSCADSRVL